MIKEQYIKLREDLYTYKYKKYVEQFKEILNNELNHCNFKILDLNLKTLKFDVMKPKKSDKGNVLGEYSTKHNKIYLTKIKEEIELTNVIMHEMLHMASSLYVDTCIVCGFAFIMAEISKGRGINEGYTSLLANRYFTPTYLSYTIETILTYFLEVIIGRKEMEKMYFLGGIKSLINELEKYNDINAIEHFISNIDLVNQKDINNIDIEIKNILNFLVETYINKLSIELENNNIDLEKFNDKINSFIREINIYKFTNKENYELLDIIEINSKINNIKIKYCNQIELKKKLTQ